MTSQSIPQEFDNATIHRRRDNDSFTIIDNNILQDPDISMDAQGVATYLLSLPTSLDIQPLKICKLKNIGRNRVYKALCDLISLGYMKKEVTYNKTEDGKIQGSRVQYYLSAFTEYTRDPHIGDLGSGDTRIREIKRKEEEVEKNNDLDSDCDADALKDCGNDDNSKEESLTKRNVPLIVSTSQGVRKYDIKSLSNQIKSKIPDASKVEIEIAIEAIRGKTSKISSAEGYAAKSITNAREDARKAKSSMKSMNRSQNNGKSSYGHPSNTAHSYYYKWNDETFREELVPIPS